LIRTRYDWEANWALDGTPGGPVWLNNTEMLITVSLDQGPFFLTVDGAVRPVLPLFGLEFVRDRYTTPAYLYVEPGAGHYHILLTDVGSGTSRVYHSDTNTVEHLSMIRYGFPFLTTDGRLIVYDGDQAWGRAVTAAGEPLAEVSDANCISLWNPLDTQAYAARTMPHNVIALYGPPDCTLLAQLQLAGFDDDATSLALLLAPGGRWLAAIPYNNGGFGEVLFILDLENLDTYIAEPSLSCVNDSEFVLDVNVPDGTHLAPGASFTKTWRLRNSGTCTWDASYRLNFIAGERMDGPESMAIGQTVLPGEQVDISVVLVAPQANGTYHGRWQLVAPDGTGFGARPYVEIVVP